MRPPTAHPRRLEGNRTTRQPTTGGTRLANRGQAAIHRQPPTIGVPRSEARYFAMNQWMNPQWSQTRQLTWRSAHSGFMAVLSETSTCEIRL